jgi:hypothetical protein
VTWEIERDNRVLLRDIIKHQPHTLYRSTPAMQQQNCLSRTSHFVADFDAVNIEVRKGRIVR